MNPDRRLTENLRQVLENEGDTLNDLHLWRLGPGHLGAVISIVTSKSHGPDFYRNKLARFRSLSHLTIEVENPTGMQIPPAN
jgi:Co/Zn/Cd efflux system component